MHSRWSLPGDVLAPEEVKNHFVLPNRFESGDAGALTSELGGWKEGGVFGAFDGKAIRIFIPLKRMPPPPLANTSSPVPSSVLL